MSIVKPTCGSQGEPADNNLTVTVGILGILGGLASVIKLVGAAESFQFAGVAASAGIWAAAGLAALAGIVYVGYSFYDNCIKDYPGIDPACISGVVDTIVPSFNSDADILFPFRAEHPRLNVVTRSFYWEILSQDAQTIYCNNDAERSPMVLTFYHSDLVCAAGLGSTIGAVAGGIGGIIAGAAVAALICASVVLSVVCIIALIVAAIIALAGVLAGASIGGNFAKWLMEGSEDNPVANTIDRGNYVTINGNLALNGNYGNARVFWFSTLNKPCRWVHLC